MSARADDVATPRESPGVPTPPRAMSAVAAALTRAGGSAEAAKPPRPAAVVVADCPHARVTKPRVAEEEKEEEVAAVAAVNLCSTVVEEVP